ncbi:intracellular septation protein A [Altererythrobacter confluentis]|uniref:Inner membrane-spanning protein YciB n=1 Tax=Allopontixanthobacter confluentis TaxID=1849021 RepID=A0A6L7GCR4_9SPHN|nr:inner membrane-spanning protein YciB [Allopontixanthobacter confluentis]MXP13832.1 intracellular septation protein A [Allopontixanthobacter confluentis]
MTEQSAVPAKKHKSGWLNVLVDYGPLVAFLGVYKYYAPAEPEIAAEIGAIVRGTLTFMIAAVVALAFSKWRFGKVSPMLWLSTALIVGFGSLTIYFRDPDLIQIKPTVIYIGFGIALIVGWMRGNALLKVLLEAAFEGLDDAGWLKLSRNWGIFFLMLAALNEGLRYFYNLENGNFDTWLWAKIWVFMPLTFLFTFSQIPMLLKHGLGIEGLEEEETTPPPTA